MATNIQSWGEGSPSSEVEAGAMLDAHPEARWLVERLSCDEDFVSGQGKRCITLSCARPVRGRWRTPDFAKSEPEANRDVGTNSEEVK